MPTLALCCQFSQEPIQFRTMTWSVLSRMTPVEREARMRRVLGDNMASLDAALSACTRLGIGAFRIGSDIVPLSTHPGSAPLWDIILAERETEEAMEAIRRRAATLGIRLSFHPSQYIVLNSLRPDVVDGALADLAAQARLADRLGADTITLHGGGKPDGVEAGIERLFRGIDRLTPRARALLALENDDRSFAPADLLPWCLSEGVPMVYDVHHHRCLSDECGVEEATLLALASWWAVGRRPYFHISSSRDASGDPRPHADFVTPADWPDCWKGLDITVDVEAKAKELAVVALNGALGL